MQPAWHGVHGKILSSEIPASTIQESLGNDKKGNNDETLSNDRKPINDGMFFSGNSAL
jgi:hypothetical protein